MRIRCVVLALLFWAGIGPALAAGNLPVQTLTLERKSADHNITILYPRTGNAVVDRQVADWAKAEADGFAEAVKGLGTLQPMGVPSSLEGSFAVIRNDSEMFGLLFQMDTYTGGAHPNHSLDTLNFVLPGGERVYLAEMVGPSGIKRISAIAIDNLTKELTGGEDSVTDADWIRRGADPFVGNFEIFSLMKDRLVLYFPEYSIAAYAAGPQKTEIPLAKLRGVIRSRDAWRNPQPSFDCARASTTVENALCADVELARLDRKLATAYYWKLQLADGDAGKARERETQRTFLTRRDAACGAQMDAALTQCLTVQYRERLKALERRPD
jgi:uncharacterized protein YecT (DUF1311 family)